jgi:hypothetical protein
MVPRDKTKLPAGVTIRTTLRPGDIGYVTYLHGTLYAAEYGWDHTFEAYVAGPLAEFAKATMIESGFGSSRKREWSPARSRSLKLREMRLNSGGSFFIRYCVVKASADS